MNSKSLVCLSILTPVLFAGFLLSSNPTSATSASTATAAVKIAASCTLTSTGGGNYSATVPNGTSAEIEGSTLTASCNDAGGFALYAVGYSNDTIGNNNMIGSSVNIATNTSGTDSYWAMKINPTTGTTPTIENSFNNYHIVPNAHTKVASYASSTGTGSLSVNATYKANISSTQLAGNYLGKVKYTLVHPSSERPAAPLAPTDCPKNSICYAPNADDIDGTMLGLEFEPVAASTKAGRQTEVDTNSEALLRAYNYSRPGYGFAGWSPSYEASTSPGSTDIIYGPQATISTNPNDPEGADVSTNGLILYPVWVASTGTMQSFTPANCSTMNIGEVTARTDIRDNETYTIAKLADGKCWMVENLRLGHEANISTTNTQSKNGAFGGVFAGLGNPDYVFSQNTTANGLYYIGTQSGTASINIGTNDYPYNRIPRYNNDDTDRNLPSSWNAAIGTNNHYQWYGYGNHYNWPASIADTSYYNNTDASNLFVEGTSLCPTNWRLPKGGAYDMTTDYVVLDIALGGTGYASDSSTDPTGLTMSKIWRSYPNNYVFSSSFDFGSSWSRGTIGIYWTLTAYNGNNSAYYFRISDAKVVPAWNGEPKYDANTIRCMTASS